MIVKKKIMSSRSLLILHFGKFTKQHDITHCSVSDSEMQLVKRE